MNNNKEKEAINLKGSEWDMGDARERETWARTEGREGRG